MIDMCLYENLFMLKFPKEINVKTHDNEHPLHVFVQRAVVIDDVLYFGLSDDIDASTFCKHYDDEVSLICYDKYGEEIKRGTWTNFDIKPVCMNVFDYASSINSETFRMAYFKVVTKDK